MALIKAVMDGKIDSSKVPTDELLKFHEFATREYINPKDRNTNNYGYTESFEMEGLNNPNVK